MISENELRLMAACKAALKLCDDQFMGDRRHLVVRQLAEAIRLTEAVVTTSYPLHPATVPVHS